MAGQHLQETSLRYFLEVVKRGSIREAAERLFVSSSAVSRQISALEDALNTQLFERRPRGMALTAAGEVLAMYARRVSLETDRVVSEIRALKGLRKGMVRVATSSGFALEFLPSVIARFQMEYPGIQFQMRVSRSSSVTTAILRGDADIGLTYSRAAERDISVGFQQAAPVMAIMKPNHPLAGSESLELVQLKPYNLALPDRDNTVRQLFDVGSSRHRLILEAALESDNFESLIHYVLHTDAVTIGGEITVRERLRNGTLVARPFRDTGMSDRFIELQTLTGRTLPEGVRAFMDRLKAELTAA